MTRSLLAWTRLGRSSANGGSASSKKACRGWRRDPELDGPGSFPPETVVAVKALACELPCEHGIPVSPLSTAEIRRAVVERGIVASIGETTVWRWLSEDAIRPWCHRSWIFPRDPDFFQKAGRVLDLYQGRLFMSRGYRRRGIRLRYGAVGKHGSIAPLGVRTPDEVYAGRAPTCEQPRPELRVGWPRGSKCASPL